MTETIFLATECLALTGVTDKFGIDSLSLPAANYKDGFERRQGNPYHDYLSKLSE